MSETNFTAIWTLKHKRSNTLMINEILFMEIRLLGEFCQKYKMSRAAANALFSKYKIWQYIESCYDIFHINGDEYNLDEISTVLKAKGAIS